jgi:hypothetical protein
MENKIVDFIDKVKKQMNPAIRLSPWSVETQKEWETFTNKERRKIAFEIDVWWNSLSPPANESKSS